MKSTTSVIHVAVLAIAAAAMLTACGGREERKAKHLERGMAYYQQAEFDKAKVELKNVLQIDPKAPEPYYMIGLIDEEQQNWRSAFGNYRKAVELNPDYLEAKVRLGRVYLLSGALPEAETITNEVLAKRPDDPGGRFLKAAVLVRKGDAAAAVREASAAVAADPAYADAASLLAGLYVREGDYANAEVVLEKAAKANPRNTALRLDLASVLTRSKDTNRAEQVYKELVALEPKTLRYHVALANFYTRAGRPEYTERTLREAVKSDPEDADRLLLLVNYLAAVGKLVQAEKELTTAIQVHPKSFRLRFGLARFYETSGRFDLAEQSYRNILEFARSGPEALRAQIGLARIKWARRDGASATKLVSDVLKENPRDNDGLQLRARIALAQGDPKQAVADLRAVVKDHPDSVEILTLLAAAHTANNEPKLAKDVFDAAVVRFPANQELRIALARFLATTKEYDRALRELETVIAMNARNAGAYQLKADIHAVSGNRRATEQALRDLKTALPEEPIGYLRLGLFYQDQKKYGEALAEFELAQKMKPDAIEPLLAIVNVLMEQGKADAAASRVAQFIKAFPGNVMAQSLLANVYGRQGKYGEAESVLQKAVQVGGKVPGPYIGLASLYSARGDHPRAIAVLQQGLAASPNDPLLATALADTFRMAGDKDRAIAEYEKVLAKNPRADVAANNLAVMLVEEKGDKASLEKALELARGFENSQNPRLLNTLGWVHFKLDQLDRALPLLQKAVTLAPTEPVFQYHLGMAWFKQGNLATAKTHLQAAVNAKTNFPGLEEARQVLAKL